MAYNIRSASTGRFVKASRSSSMFGPKLTRVIINRNAMNDLELAVADGVEVVVRNMMQSAVEKVPFDEGSSGRRHLRDTAGWAVWNGNRKVAGDAAKPRDLRGRKGTVMGAAGFGSPLAHLLERGTALRRNEAPNRATGRGPALPFLMPAFQQETHDLPSEIGAAIRIRIPKPALGSRR